MAVAPDDKEEGGSHSKKKIAEKPKFNYSEDLKAILALKIPSPWLKRDLNRFLELSKAHIEEIKREDWSKVAESFCDESGNCTVNDCLELIKSLRSIVDRSKGGEDEAFLSFAEEVNYIITMAQLDVADPLKKRGTYKDNNVPTSGSSEWTKHEIDIILKHVEKNKDLWILVSKNKISPKSRIMNKERLKKLSDLVGRELNRRNINLTSILEQMKFNIVGNLVSRSPSLSDDDKKRFWAETPKTLQDVFDYLKPLDITKEGFEIKEKKPLEDSKDESVPEVISTNAGNAEVSSEVVNLCEPDIPEVPLQAENANYSASQVKKRGRKPKKSVENSEELSNSKKKEEEESGKMIIKISDTGTESDVTETVNSAPQPKKRGRKPKALTASTEESLPMKSEKPKSGKKNFRQTRGRFVSAYDDEDVEALVKVCVECLHLFQQDPVEWDPISKKVQEEIDPKKKLNFLPENCQGILVSLKKKFEENKSKLNLTEEPLSRLYESAKPLLPYIKDSVSTTEHVDKHKRERVNTTHFSPPASPAKHKFKPSESKEKRINNLEPVVVLNRHDIEPKINSVNGKESSERSKSVIQGLLNYELKAARLPKVRRETTSDSDVEMVEERAPLNHSEPVHQWKQDLLGPSTSKRNTKQSISSKTKKKRKRRNRSESSESSSEDDSLGAKLQASTFNKHNAFTYNTQFEDYKQRLHAPIPRNVPKNKEGQHQRPELDMPFGQSTSMMPFNQMDPDFYLTMMVRYQATQAFQTNQYLNHINEKLNQLTDLVISKKKSRKKKEKKKRREEDSSSSSD